MTAFADFLDLQAAVVDLTRDASVVEVMPRLVKLAEAQFNNELRCREQFTSTSLTFTSGVATLPSDFLEIIGLYDSNGFEYIQQPLQNARVTNTHRHFYALNASQITTSGADGARTLEYYAAIPTLTDGGVTDSNWLLQKHPALYLYAVAAEAAKWLRDAEGAQQMMALADMELARAAARDASERYARARVRVGGVTP